MPQAIPQPNVTNITALLKACLRPQACVSYGYSCMVRQGRLTSVSIKSGRRWLTSGRLGGQGCAFERAHFSAYISGPYKSTPIAAPRRELRCRSKRAAVNEPQQTSCGAAVDEEWPLLLRRAARHVNEPQQKSRSRRGNSHSSSTAAAALQQLQLAASIAAPVKKTPQQKRFYTIPIKTVCCLRIWSSP